jgi:5-methylcytosine-specific restriction endonuclease McrBC regulatory subunit McrC
MKSGKQVLILDAKYKKSNIEREENHANEELTLPTNSKYKNISNNDINQMWIYCVALAVPIGMLVYPNYLSITEDIRTLKQTNNQIIIKSIDLNQNDYNLFIEKCNKFIFDILKILRILK